jgi:RNA-directed DNA polymerase
VEIAKPYDVSPYVVKEAYRRVKANNGAAGVDEVTISQFEENAKGNLYKIWNRMSSGSYFPPAVRMVEIPKSDGGKRKLGIPTVGDRIAQMVVKIYLELPLEEQFHADSYGYRLGKSALDAVGKARERRWKYDWVLDLDIQGFFDNIDHDLMMRAVKRHTKSKWILLYVERWLKAPIQTEEGQVQERTKGTPQGGVISPLLANLFLHYAFDKWMEREYPGSPFERYADDIVIHCKTETEAREIWEAVEKRLEDCKLKLHPQKTKLVYCKDGSRTGNSPNEKFDFLGYTFRARESRTRWGKKFINFSPAIGDKAVKTIRETVRSWQLNSRGEKELEELAKELNPRIRGWLNYYSKYYKSAVNPVFAYINRRLAKWAQKKYKKLRGSISRAIEWIEKVANSRKELFAHWAVGITQVAGQ